MVLAILKFPLMGYLADVHLVDGTAVTETNGVIDEFGEFDSYNAVGPTGLYAGGGGGQ